MRIKLPLCFAILFFALGVKSQIPDYFANDPEWRVFSSYSLGSPCIYTDNYVYYLGSDTTINGKIYKKLYKRGNGKRTWYGGSPAPSNCAGKTYFHQFLFPIIQQGRQIYRNDNGSDHLFLDYSYEVGDTIADNFNHLGATITVTGVDSVLINNEYRRKLYLSDSTYPKFLIEGIGHAAGFFEQMELGIEFSSELMCYSLSGVKVWGDTSSFCAFDVDIIENQTISKPFIFPNPATDQLQLELPIGSTPFRYSIYDAFGKRLIDGKLDDQNGVIDIVGLKPGSYILRSDEFYWRFFKM